MEETNDNTPNQEEEEQNSLNQEEEEQNTDAQSITQENKSNPPKKQNQENELQYPALPPSYSSMYNVQKSCVCNLLKSPKHGRAYEHPECTSVSISIIQQPANSEEPKSPRKKTQRNTINSQNQTQEKSVSLDSPNDENNGNADDLTSPQNEENQDRELDNNAENNSTIENHEKEDVQPKNDAQQTLKEAKSVLDVFSNGNHEVNENEQKSNEEENLNEENEEEALNEPKSNENNSNIETEEEDTNRAEAIENSMRNIRRIQQKRKAQRNRIKARLTGTEEDSHLRKEPFSMKLYKDNLERLYPETRGTYTSRSHPTRPMAKTTGSVKSRSIRLDDTNNDSFFTMTGRKKDATLYRPSTTSNQRSCSCRTMRHDENNSLLRSPILARSSNEFFTSLTKKYTAVYTNSPYGSFNMIECRLRSIESARQMRKDYNDNLANLRKIENEEHKAAVKLSYEREPYHGDEMTHPFYPSLRITPTHFRQSHNYPSKKFI